MHGVTARDHCILLTKFFFPNISFSVMSSFIFWRNLLSLMSHKQLGKAGRTKGGDQRRSPFLEILTLAGNLPQLAADAARLCYLQGNSRGRRRAVFGEASPQRAQLPQDRGERA